MQHGGFRLMKVALDLHLCGVDSSRKRRQQSQRLTELRS